MQLRSYLSLVQLLLSLSMQVHKCVKEIRNTCTNIEEINKLVVEIKVKEVWHGL